VNFSYQGINIPITGARVVSHLTVRAEIADGFAEWDMHIQSQIFAVGIRKNLIILVPEDKWLY
jgi:hypothetical protein